MCSNQVCELPGPVDGAVIILPEGSNPFTYSLIHRCI
jgi:hypothetical protein